MGRQVEKGTGRGARRARRAGFAALAAGAAAGAVFVGQRRLQARVTASAADLAEAGLTMPEGLVHHEISVDDGGVIHAVEAGRGQPLVLLHGVCLSARTWVHQLRDLSDSHRVIALDMRGHGQSVPGSDGFGEAEYKRGRPMALERLASDVRQVIEELDAEGALLVGHSMGGMVAMQTALDAERGVGPSLSGLALVSTTAGPLLSLPGWDFLCALVAPATRRGIEASDRFRLGAVPTSDLRYWAARWGFGADPLPAQVRYTEKMIAEMPAATLAGVLESLARVDISDRLDHIDLPTLVVVGTHDRLTPQRHSRRLANTIPDSRLFDLARCGHMPMLERPGEFARLLEEHALKVA